MKLFKTLDNGVSSKLDTAFILLLGIVLLAGCAKDPASAPEKAAPGDAQVTSEAQGTDLCLDAGPQTPRDIADPSGLNPVRFELAPASTEMNLCNVHTHTQAEHKGPGFSVFVGDGVNGGYACNDSAELTEAELADPAAGEGAYGDVEPGDTIEVHWVFSSCPVAPGEGLGSCLSDGCTEPLLRVESQVFLVVNDPSALDFMDYVESSDLSTGLHQPTALPVSTGEPVVFRGSTTGPSYTQSECSPLQVTWSVRPECARLDISSLHEWASGDGNIFNESKSHGVRQLVTAPELLAQID